LNRNRKPNYELLNQELDEEINDELLQEEFKMIDDLESASKRQFKFFKCSCYNIKFLYFILCSFVLAMFFALYLIQYQYPTIETLFYGYESFEWENYMNNSGTESCIRLYDIDGDGLDDIIFGLAGI